MNLLEALENDKSGWAVIEPTHTTPTEIEFHETDSEPSLEVMQKAVGGYIEHVTLSYVVGDTYEGEDLVARIFRTAEADGVVNEEGKLHGLRYNPLASAWYANPNDVIVGPMLVCLGAARMK